MKKYRMPWDDHVASLDFEHWAGKRFWTIEEAVALSLGKHPGVVTFKNMKKVDGQGMPFVEEYFRRFDDVQRANAEGEFGHCNETTVKPDVFMSLARGDGLKCPEALIDEVKKAEHEIKRSRKQSKTKERRGRPASQRKAAKEALEKVYPEGVPQEEKNDVILAEVNDYLKINKKPPVSIETIARAQGKRPTS